jgi:hypothetical protein
MRDAGHSPKAWKGRRRAPESGSRADRACPGREWQGLRCQGLRCQGLRCQGSRAPKLRDFPPLRGGIKGGVFARSAKGRAGSEASRMIATARRPLSRPTPPRPSPERREKSCGSRSCRPRRRAATGRISSSAADEPHPAVTPASPSRMIRSPSAERAAPATHDIEVLVRCIPA